MTLENLGSDITTVRTEGVTLDGLIVGKYLSRSKFERSLPLGPALSDLTFACDVGGTPYLGWWDDWRQDCLGDIHQRPDLDTLAPVASMPGVAACLVDHCHVSGDPLPVCPRSVLKNVIGRLASRGLSARAAFEIEGMVFAESYAQARQKGYRDLTPIGVPVPVAYLVHDAYLMRGFFEDVVRRLDTMGIGWEAWSAEGAPGQFEVNLPAADALVAADACVRVRAAIREAAVDAGLSVTFMAKPTEAYGNGMHVHHSIRRDGDSAFYDEASPDGRTEIMRNWIGGLIATMPAAHSFLSPTINSYRRLVSFAGAPVVVSWSEDNKSTALRTISRSDKLARVEHRVGAADLNPYLALAVILAGGVAGVEQAIAPPDELRIMAWGLPDRFEHLPSSITAAAEALTDDKLLADVLGAPLVDHWTNTRRWEWMMFHTTGGDAGASTVTDWELNRYFELI